METISKRFSDAKIKFQKETFAHEKHPVYRISQEDLLSAAMLFQTATDCTYDLLENILIFKKKKTLNLYYYFRSLDEGHLTLLRISEELTVAGVLELPSLRNIWSAAGPLEDALSQQFTVEFSVSGSQTGTWKILNASEGAELAH